MGTLALTPGEPAGIGPDLVTLWAQQDRDVDLVVVADPDLLRKRARLRGVPLTLRTDPDQPTRAGGELTIVEVPAGVPVEPGQLNPDNAPYVLQTLDLAIDECRAGRFAGLVTGPVQKSVINEAGVDFTGHTEYLAARCASPRVVMLLVAGEMRVALATTHVALRDVAPLITEALIHRTKQPGPGVLADRPAIQLSVADLEVDLTVARAALDRIARLADAFVAEHSFASAAPETFHPLAKEFQSTKYFVQRRCIDIVDRAMTLSGGAGYMSSNPLSRLYRDVRAGPFMQPFSPNEALIYIGRVALGRDPTEDL